VGPLSFAQERLWLVHQLAPAHPDYNVQRALRLRGDIDAGALDRALGRLIDRHPSLRTAFVASDGSPAQVVREQVVCPLDRTDVRDDPDPEAAVRRLAAEVTEKPFVLERAPLLRLRLLRLAEREHVLLLVLHHMVADGWSLQILQRDLERLYAEETGCAPEPLPALTVTPAEHAEAQRARFADGVPRAQRRFWAAELRELERTELPTDRPPSEAEPWRADYLDFALPDELVAAADAFAHERRATPFAVLLTAFQLLLSRYTGAERVAVGVPASGRLSPSLEDVVGFLVNTLVVRADLRGDPAFADATRGTVRKLRHVLAYQEVPFQWLVKSFARERDADRNPFFEIAVGHQDLGRGPVGEEQLSELRFERFDLPTTTARWDVELQFTREAEAASARLIYKRDIFDRDLIAGLPGAYLELLAGALTSPRRRLSKLPLLEPGAPRWVDPAAEPAADESFAGPTVVALFERRVATDGARVAVVSPGEEVSYAELDRRATRLAAELRGRGACRGTVVAFCLERTTAAIATMLAVLKTGAAYLPLDPGHPPERNARLVEDAGAVLTVTRGGLLGGGEGAADGEGPHPDDLAYLIYTSGSTGTPKGVAVSHRNLASLLAAAVPVVRAKPGDVWTCVHSFSFDVSAWEVWGALTTGGTLVLVPGETAKDPEALLDVLERRRVTILCETPTAFGQLVWATRSAAPRLSLDTIALAGEAVDPAAVLEWFDRFGEERPRVLNLYGPTETTVYASWCELSAEAFRPSAGTPIGRPLPNRRLYVLDRFGEPLPPGVPGELHIGGEGVSAGYLGKSELTAAAFTPDPFGAPGDRLYRTGDYARVGADGAVEFLGRRDDQVKVRGFRVELGEIRARLVEHARVRDAAVVAEGTGLTGLVVPSGGDAPDARALRPWLRERLPDYMVPARYVAVNELPTTTSGKLDRAALRALVPADEPPDDPADDAFTEAQTLVLELCRELLPGDRYRLDDDFFEIGGDSLLAMRLTARVRQLLGVELPLRAVFDCPTLGELSSAIDERRARTGVRAQT